MPTKIIIVDDHKMIRDGLRNLLEKQKNFEVVADTGDGQEAVKLVGKLTPHLVIMDISMKGLNGIEATRQILSRQPQMKIITLSMHSDRRFVFEALKAGVKGYLLKECAYEELMAAIQSVLSNRTYLSPKLSDVILKDYIGAGSAKNTSVFSKLTSRECEVLQMMAEGKSIKDIAFHLRVSGKTVETYKQHIMDKLDLHTVADLTKYAIREGLTTLE